MLHMLISIWFSRQVQNDNSVHHGCEDGIYAFLFSVYYFFSPELISTWRSLFQPLLLLLSPLHSLKLLLLALALLIARLIMAKVFWWSHFSCTVMYKSALELRWAVAAIPAGILWQLTMVDMIGPITPSYNAKSKASHEKRISFFFPLADKKKLLYITLYISWISLFIHIYIFI